MSDGLRSQTSSSINPCQKKSAENGRHACVNIVCISKISCLWQFYLERACKYVFYLGGGRDSLQCLFHIGSPNRQPLVLFDPRSPNNVTRMGSGGKGRASTLALMCGPGHVTLRRPFGQSAASLLLRGWLASLPPCRNVVSKFQDASQKVGWL